ncbi:hypothetical protein [Niabella hirudinis]|uniref:hypothetical protein n=1 Tax=Niabella hirudinis TaxID=1285929 RepID=UPI003EBE8E1F
MRSFFYLVFVVLLLVQCKKAADTDASNAFASDSYCANCGSVRFHILLSDKTTGSNYITANNIASTDIEIRNAFSQTISSSNISVSLNDPQGAIIFPMPDRSRFFLKIRNTLLLEVSYTSKLNNAGQYEISGVKVKDRASTFEKITGGYLLKIDI